MIFGINMNLYLDGCIEYEFWSKYFGEIYEGLRQVRNLTKGFLAEWATIFIKSWNNGRIDEGFIL